MFEMYFPLLDRTLLTISIVSLAFLISGCSGPYEYRKPDPSEGVKNRDDITVYPVKNSSVDGGTSFNKILNSDGARPSQTFLVTAFPDAHKRLKRYLVSILKKNPDTIQIPADLRTRVHVPFRYPSEEEEAGEWTVFESEQTVDPKTFSPESAKSASPGDLFITGHLRNGVVGMGRLLEEHTGKIVPRDHVYFRVETTWRYGRPENDSEPVTVRIIDDVLVNFVNHPDPISRLYLVRKTFHRLLLRVAWRMASKIIPHQYNTSFSFRSSN